MDCCHFDTISHRGCEKSCFAKRLDRRGSRRYKNSKWLELSGGAFSFARRPGSIWCLWTTSSIQIICSEKSWLFVCDIEWGSMDIWYRRWQQTIRLIMIIILKCIFKGLGLQQFDYSSYVSGLRYTPKSTNLSERLFNPYQFFGYQRMWPRGFPLEYLRGHSNGRDRLILCRKMKAAVVQQGIVHNDPDVDAIYRLLNADKQSGLHITFNKFAPPIILEERTYSPWNSQNTLFHYSAFFTMFLPTTVAFR